MAFREPPKVPDDGSQPHGKRSPNEIVVGRANSPITDEVAQTARQVLETMARNGIDRSARALVDQAKNKAHPLHNYFLWDDAQAADLHRLNQARKLISHVMTIEYVNRRRTPVRTYYQLFEEPKQKDRPRVFIELRDVIKDDVQLAKRESIAIKLIRGVLRGLAAFGFSEVPRWRRIMDAVDRFDHG